MTRMAILGQVQLHGLVHKPHINKNIALTIQYIEIKHLKMYLKICRINLRDRV